MMPTLHLTPDEFGLVRSAVRQMLKKDDKDTEGLIRKFGEEARLPTRRREALDRLAEKVEEAWLSE